MCTILADRVCLICSSSSSFLIYLSVPSSTRMRDDDAEICLTDDARGLISQNCQQQCTCLFLTVRLSVIAAGAAYTEKNDENGR